MWTFPARFLAEFFDHHGMLGFRDRPRWRTIRGGSKRYVEALIAPFSGSPAPVARRCAAVARGAGHVLVRPRGGEAERFDEVVLATHSDQALALLEDASRRASARCSAAIPYQRNEAVLHTDVRMLPRRRRAWASWNYHLQPEPAGRATVTYHMNRLQSLRAEREFCVTLNRTEAIDPAKVIRTIDYAHPVYTAAGVAGAAAVRRDQRPPGHAFLRRLLGLGVPRGRRPQRAAGGRAVRRGGCDELTASCIYEGDDPPPADRSRDASSATGWRCSTSTSTSCRRCSAAG